MPQLLRDVEIPEGIDECRLPDGVQRRLQQLLDKQDFGTPLTAEESSEAEGLVELAEFLSLLKLRARGPVDNGADLA